MLFSRTQRPRWIAGISCALGLFATTLAFTASTTPMASPDLGVVASAIAAGAGAWLLSRAQRRRRALMTLVLASFGLGLLNVFALLSLQGQRLAGSTSLEAMVRLGVGIWVTDSFFRAAGLASLSLSLRRDPASDALDALERAQLASATWLLAALTESVVLMHMAHTQGASYQGLAAPALGPTLVALVALAGTLSLGALVRSVRWMWRWRQALRSQGMKIVPLAEWVGAVPSEVLLSVRGARVDAVLVRHASATGSAYRGGELSQAIGRVPSRSGPVFAMLVGRSAFATMLLGAIALLSVGELATLRW